MINVQDHIYDDIDSVSLYQNYQLYRQNNKFYDKFISYVIPIFDSVFRYYESKHVDELYYDDLLQDVLIKIIGLNNVDCQNPGSLYNYVYNICQNTILSQSDEYDSGYESLDDAEYYRKIYNDNSYGTFKIFNSINLKIVILRLIDEFKYKIHRRFKDDNHIKASLYVFDCIMNNTEPREDSIRRIYKIRYPDFIIAFSNIIYKDCLYKLRISFLPELRINN